MWGTLSEASWPLAKQPQESVRGWEDSSGRTEESLGYFAEGGGAGSVSAVEALAPLAGEVAPVPVPGRGEGIVGTIGVQK